MGFLGEVMFDRGGLVGVMGFSAWRRDMPNAAEGVWTRAAA